jgi:hypothetical protein
MTTENEALGFLRQARAVLVEQQQTGGLSRDVGRTLAIVITNTETTILWAQQLLSVIESETTIPGEWP